MKIAFLALKGFPFPGGVERYMEQVGPRLVARGHRIRLYAISRRTRCTEHCGMEIRRVPALGGSAFEKPSAALLAAAREAIGDSDIVHLHAFGPSLFGYLPRAAGKRVVVQGHGLEWRRSKWGWAGRSFLRFAEAASVRMPHALTVVSRTQQAYLRARYGVEAEYIPSGVGAAAPAEAREISQLGLEPGEFVLFAARLEREKGAALLIEAFRSLDTRMKLVIAGDTSDRRHREELRTLAGGDARVLFIGFATGRLLAELYSNCLIYCLPSEVEGLSLAVREAMSYGAGCLVSDIPENREAIDGCGFTFANGDVRDLARQLSVLLRAPARVREMGEAARNHARERFDWSRVVIDLESLYRRVLAQ